MTEIAAKLITLNEGYRQKPYRCTAGKLTIGIGRNLDDKGISQTEAKMLLDLDIAEVTTDLKKLLPDFVCLSAVRKAVLIDMRFQLGYTGFRSFKKMIRAVNEGRIEDVAAELLDSKYAKIDTPRRAQRNAQMYKSNIYLA